MFSDGRRHLEYVRVPIGAKNSSASMQCLMELVMRGLPVEYLLVYMDDILLATPTEEMHLEILERVFEALARAGLKVHPHKCTFAQTSATTLGMEISAEGLRPDSRNLEKIREWPPPKDVTGVRAYLGLLNYYRSHILNFAFIAEPLTDLLKKDSSFEWTDKCQTAFEQLKDKLLTGTAISYPDFKKDFFVKADASGASVGAVLTQRDERGKEVLIAAASQRLGATEMKWAPFDREMYAIVWSVRTFSHYLKFRPFTVFTDHRPLLTCLSTDPKKDATGKRTRWALELSGYDFSLKYKPGKRHGDADALSRATHGDPPYADPRDADDLVLLGAVRPADGPVIDLLASEAG